MIFLGLLDSIKDQMEANSEHSDEITNQNVRQTLEIASRKLLQKVSNNDIELDVKDLKDIASVYQMLNQTDGQAQGTGTPEAPQAMLEAFTKDDILQAHKSADEKQTEIDQSRILDLSASDVDKLIHEQYQKTNQSNYDKNQAQ